MPSIEAKAVGCRFGPAVALEGVSFTLAAGSWTYVMGPSASGKTTLLRAIAGLQPLDRGEILIEGRVATNRRIAIAPHERSVGLLVQGPSLWPHLSAAANVALGVPDAIRGKARREEAARWLAELAIAPLAAKFPGELSGGEARLVALARALASRPRILLLDEPTAHLDLHLSEGMMELLRRFHADFGLTTVCVTHQIEPPMRAEERVLILEQGWLLYDGHFSNLSEAARTPFLDALRKSARRLSARGQTI